MQSIVFFIIYLQSGVAERLAWKREVDMDVQTREVSSERNDEPKAATDQALDTI